MQVKLPDGEKTLLEMNKFSKTSPKGSHGGGSQVESPPPRSSGFKAGFAFPLSILPPPRGMERVGRVGRRTESALGQNGVAAVSRRDEGLAVARTLLTGSRWRALTDAGFQGCLKQCRWKEFALTVPPLA